MIVAIVVLVACFVGGASAPLMGSPVPAQDNTGTSALTSSVWDGVYSEEQARRGEALYRDKCSSCHLDNLMGHEYAPPLTVEYFLGDWGMGAHTVADLFERIRKTMPKDDPGSLGERGYIDVLAYLLQANHFPNGPAPLDADTARLAHIGMSARPPR